MTKKTVITFIDAKTEDWGQKQVALSQTLVLYLASGKAFTVVFDYIKTPKQLRYYWRLVDLVLPYLQETHSLDDKDEVSDFIKTLCGYFKTVKAKGQDVVIPKSLRKASKSEIMTMIDKLMFICEQFKIKDYEITEKEKQDLDNIN